MPEGEFFSGDWESIVDGNGQKRIKKIILKGERDPARILVILNKNVKDLDPQKQAAQRQAIDFFLKLDPELLSE